MLVPLVSVLVAFLCLQPHSPVADAQINTLSSGGYRLERTATYIIVAPAKIYPDEVYQVAVSIFELFHPTIHVHASISKWGEELVSFTTTFTEPSTRYLQMWMPESAQPGEYSLKVSGSPTAIGSGNMGNIFQNETKIIFDTKQVSIFIQTNKPVYKQGQMVMFRIIPVRPNLLSVSGSMDIYVVDATGTVVRRWLSEQTNAGIVDMEVQLSEQPAYGTWAIRVVGWGHVYNKTFQVEEFFEPRFYVNVSMPAYMMDGSFALAGVISANHTSGQPCRGTGVVRLEIRPPLADIQPRDIGNFPFIERPIPFFEGRTDFMFTMRDLEELQGGSLAGKELHVNATVTDWYTFINQTGYAITVIHGREVSVKLLGDPSRTFKPGFPVNVYYAVMQADGTPLYGIRRQITIHKSTRSTSGRISVEEIKRIVPDDGIVHYQFFSDEDAQMITVRAYYDAVGYSQAQDAFYYRVFSHYNQYIHIDTYTQRPVVNEYMIFTVRTNVWVERIYYLIIAGGNIIVGNQLEMNSMQKTFSVALSRDMVPSAHMIAYFVKNHEVVADVINFHVNGTILNPIDVFIGKGRDFSRDTVTLTSLTTPGSYIAYSGIDYELYKYGGTTFITENEIIEELQSYDSLANQSFSHTWYDGEAEYRKVFYPSGSYAVDANTTFAYTGLIVFTDANLTRIMHPCNETQGFLPCNDGSCYEKEQRCDRVRQCQDGVDELGCTFEEKSPYTPLFKRFKHIARHYDEDGAWLWHANFNKPDGRYDVQVDVPKEPMSWVLSGLSMSLTDGLGIVRRPSRFQSTRDFYIQVEMPDHAYKGEQLGVRIALFNYWGQNMECLVMLHDSEYYRFIVVDDFGVVSSYSPRTTRGDIQTMVYVPAGQMVSLYMPVLPVENGEVDVTVSATSFMGSQVITRRLSIEYDGVTNHYHTPYLIDLVNQGSLIIPDFEIPIWERFVMPERREHLYVPGSPKAEISLIGDMVGPGFFKPVLNARNYLNMPYGGAEQNIFNFALNLYNLKFLKITNQLPMETLLSALEGMNLDLQRQLGYMNATDGSFSMFRDYGEPTPSVWVTAFTLETLNNADEADWRHYIYIPNELLNKIATWITTQQDKSTGAFSEQGPIYNTRFQDNETMVNGQPVNQKISLTAFVLSALAQTSGLTGNSQILVSNAIQLAKQYLERRISELNDPYQTALVTYALTVSDSKNRNDAFQRLNALKRVSEYTYWANADIPANPSTIVNTVPFQLPRRIYANEGSAVETTAYALQIYLINNRYTESLSIMKWLQTMRNTIGGFDSTRDTIVALQALTAYGKRDTNRHIYNMEVTMDFTSIPIASAQQRVRLNKTNWQTLQVRNVPENKVYGQVRASVKGTGIALMQMHTSSNVEYKWLQEVQANGTFFNLTVERIKYSGRNFSIMEMTTCVRWIRPDIRQRTGLVVVEADLPTGYVVMNDYLREYVRSGVVPGLGRAEFHENKMIFYLDYLNAFENRCVYFRADRWYPVANATIQHLIKVYDFYEAGMYNLSMYTTYDLHNLHICQVCGSFQCPYCPFYNAATSIYPNILVTLIFTYAIIFFSQKYLRS